MAEIEKIGQNMRKIRKKVGLTQVGVARAAKMHANHYGKIERGKANFSLRLFLGIAKALRVKPSELWV